MDDKTILEGILWDLKVLGDLCLHGTIESGTKEVHATFLNSLNEVLILQNDLYNLMSEEKMYSPSKVEQNKIKKTKEKFNPNLEKD